MYANACRCMKTQNNLSTTKHDRHPTMPNPPVSIFFELIQVSIGIRATLSYSPSEKEWRTLYGMAQKQTILGVCLLGVQKLSQKYPEQTEYLPKELRMQWLAAVAEIQRQNELMDMRCSELQRILEKDGLQACILKGQGVASLYRLQEKSQEGLRQPGDIDVWIKDTDIPQLVKYLHSRGLKYHATIAHVECNFFPQVTVEFHAVPAFLRNFYYNRRLQQWCATYNWTDFNKIKGFTVPSDSFNLVFLLVHLYHHFLYEGVGFRQLMDYLMLLRSLHAEKRQTLYQETMQTLKSLGMQKFTQGVMDVMQEVFLMPRELMLCEPDPKVGKILLADMLESGNMGKYHSNKTANRRNRMTLHWTNFKRNMAFLSISPSEVLASPVWSLWHWGWRRWKL